MGCDKTLKTLAVTGKVNINEAIQRLESMSVVFASLATSLGSEAMKEAQAAQMGANALKEQARAMQTNSGEE